MKTAFEKHLLQLDPDARHHHFVVALSGGLDSVVLLHLMKTAGLHMIAAHVNYRLREDESDGDEAFVRQLCNSLTIPLEVLRLEGEDALHSESENLQSKAREIRYSFFEKIRTQNGFHWIATAHHADDQAETILHQYLRGGGLAALRGMLPVNDAIIRPLLSFRKEELETYAKQCELVWRNDSSNDALHYTRNQLRHAVIPMLETMYPGFGFSLLRRIPWFREAEILIRKTAGDILESHLKQEEGASLLPVRVIAESGIDHLLIWQWIKPFGFHPAQTAEILRLILSPTGSFVATEGWRVWKEGEYLALVEEEVIPPVVVIQGAGSFDSLDVVITTEIPTLFERDYHTAWFDLAKISWPLVLRPWKEGDKMQPFGMQGHQLVSDIIQNKGVKAWRRTSVRVLESQDKILFVPTLRHAAHAAITEETTEALCIRYHGSA